MKKTISTFVLAALAMTAAAQKVFDSPLYSGKAPHNNGDDQDTAKVRVYLPDSKVATGRAVVICPGGGYDHLSMQKEGYDWGEFLQNQGIAAIVLKYRMPHGDVDVPVSDAENAIKFVRRNASSWHVNINNVGIMGFSAGGHLASVIATRSKGDAKPDFQILFYPVITMMEGFTHEGSRKNLLGNKGLLISL